MTKDSFKKICKKVYPNCVFQYIGQNRFLACQDKDGNLALWATYGTYGGCATIVKKAKDGSRYFFWNKAYDYSILFRIALWLNKKFN